MFKPVYSLGFLLAAGIACLALSLAFPQHGLVAGGYKFKFFDVRKLLTVGDTSTTKAIAIEDLFAIYEAEDSLVKAESFDSTVKRDAATSALLANLNIQYAEGATNPLNNFFKGLLGLSQKGTSLRILHYGDSQIEGDRITSSVRNTLQAKFGGSGPGLLPIVEVVPSTAALQSVSPNWKRHALFGGAKNELEHSDFGALASMATFDITDEQKAAWVRYEPSKNGAASVRKYDKAVLSLGNVTTDCRVEFLVKDEVVSAEDIPAGTNFKKITKHFDITPPVLEIRFTADSSPNVYSVALESNAGLKMDNIGMRGSSGTEFRKMSRKHLNAVFNGEHIGLIILQYGGNSVPYIKDSAHAEWYGKAVAAQIKYLQSVLPEASVILIGPSDMSTSVDGEFKTYPNLVYVRNALKNAALNNGCAFWDLYEVMGGENSMVNWVTAEPPLAAPDYVHLTPAGARKVADLFTKHLLLEFDKWKNEVAVP